jgi:hypothetical protein
MQVLQNNLQNLWQAIAHQKMPTCLIKSVVGFLVL